MWNRNGQGQGGREEPRPDPAFGGLLGNVTPLSIGLADQMRLQRQAAVYQKTGCMGGCPPGISMEVAVPLRETYSGESLNVRVRCNICLTYYEITPQGEIISARRPVEEAVEIKRLP